MEKDAFLSGVTRATFIESAWWRVPKGTLVTLGALSFQMISARWFLFSGGRIGT
jgi:hypothetical protein